MSGKPIQILSPVGRMIGGSLYDPRTTDFDGKPLVVKNGASTGQPRKDFNFGVAFPKTPGCQHWANEPWMRPIWDLAQASFPAGEPARHDFAWKITDGDSTMPNKRQRKPCDQEGYPGHWVIWFSGATQPRLTNANGSAPMTEPNAIKPGYYVQVLFNVKDNKPSQSPGLYMNHQIVALSGYGEEIVVGPDPSTVGFGQAPLPPGASTAPVAAMVAPAVPGAPAVVAPLIPNLPTAGSVPGQPVVAPTAVAPAIPVVPNPTVLAPPVVPAVPAAPVIAAPPAATPQRVLTAAANGATYEALIAKGWNDALLIQHGLMVMQ